MKVYKFGGASIQNVENVRNVIKAFIQTRYSSTILVVFAMEKTINSLENVVTEYFQNDNYLQIVDRIEEEYLDIIENLFLILQMLLMILKIFL
ncbi:hypothetical protein [Apibacter sp.]|jgi:hypothetical protein|uniref:hypothetical protein n=1 Tax=Apibacter sp. TaxID=2023709 RepID=UPI0025E3D03B|nr:hypothetical protein [Apibacter sp.]MCT6869186.1 hypothetical protein [Apibacter sp.]